MIESANLLYVGDIHSGPDVHSNKDCELIKYVKIDYSKGNPPLIFVQPLRRQLDLSDDDPLKVIDSILEVDKLDGPVFFGSSGFLRSADSNVRNWLLAEAACKNDQLTTVPSVELLL